MPGDIKERTLDFAIRIVRLADKMPNSQASMIITKQLIRSGTSIGANVEEANAAPTRKDFAYRLNVALCEARETKYWLSIIRAVGYTASVEVNSLFQECEELCKILGAIVSTARGKRIH
ncbi:MAG: four helix bundle protein [bacterium]